MIMVLVFVQVQKECVMRLFEQMAGFAAANLLGASADQRISNEQLSEQLERMALSDPELAEHYARLCAALPALQARRALEDAEMSSALVGRPEAA